MKELSGAATPQQAVEGFLTGGAQRLATVDVGRVDPSERMLGEVIAGLADPHQPWIPATYFYDAHGSELYEAITELPEYYPTRTEAALLARIAPELNQLLDPAEVIELGSGSSTKTRLILDALGAAQPRTYVPVDVSATMLADSAARLARSYPRLRVLGLVGDYEDAFAVLGERAGRLVVFLGGTIGNFPPAYQTRFFTRLGRLLRPGSHLLVGFDRQAHIGKSAARIQAAYDDEQGVTACFNLNMLRHLNRVLGADFRLGAWSHQAIYNGEKHQIEMYLVSLDDQVVHFPGAARAFRFRQGERILSEISRKFDPAKLAGWFDAVGFQRIRAWSDEDALYGLMLLERRGPR